MADYPLPSHVAQIYISGDQLFLVLPPYDQGETRSHTLTFPDNEKGIAIVLSILRARKFSSHQVEDLKIGNKAAPVQYDVEKMLRAMGKDITKVPPRARVDAPRDMTLEDLGL